MCDGTGLYLIFLFAFGVSHIQQTFVDLLCKISIFLLFLIMLSNCRILDLLCKTKKKQKIKQTTKTIAFILGHCDDKKTNK